MNRLSEFGDSFVGVDYSDILEKTVSAIQNTQDFFKLSKNNDLTIAVDEIAQKVAASNCKHPLGSSANQATFASVNFADSKMEEAFFKQINQVQGQLEISLKQTFSETDVTQLAKLVEPLEEIDSKATNRRDLQLGLTYPFSEPFTNLKKQQLRVVGSKANSFAPSQISKAILRSHKVTISIDDTNNWKQALVEALLNYTKTEFSNTADELEMEDLEELLREMVESPQSDFDKLVNMLNTQIIGRVKKKTLIKYLEYLTQNLEAKPSSTTNSGNNTGISSLRALISRLKLLDEYINDQNLADSDFMVSYGGSDQYNLREAFSAANALEALPVITMIDGYLGETTDAENSKREFIFGVKLKFNNKANAQGDGKKTVFEYNLDQINPSSATHQANLASEGGTEYFKQKVLRLFVLYYFVFAHPKNYDSVRKRFEEEAFPILHGFEEAAKKKLLSEFCRELTEGQRVIDGQRGQQAAIEKSNDKVDLKELVKWLRINIKSKAFKNKQYAIHIEVDKSILLTSLDEIFDKRTFFKPVFAGVSGEFTTYNSAAALRYVKITDSAEGYNPDVLYTLTGNLAFANIEFSEAGVAEFFDMQYNVTGIGMLPILFVPIDEGSRKVYIGYFRQHKSVIISYSPTYLNALKSDSPQTFLYRFVFNLLSYLALKMIADLAYTSIIKETDAGADTDEISAKIAVPKLSTLFLALVRVHLTDKANSNPQESFIRSNCKVLAHLLNEDYLANSQGFNTVKLGAALPEIKGSAKVYNETAIQLGTKKYPNYKVQNSLSSLYSVLPKQFSLTKTANGSRSSQAASTSSTQLPFFEAGNQEEGAADASTTANKNSAQVTTNANQQTHLDKLAVIVVSSRESERKRKNSAKVSSLVGEIISIERVTSNPSETAGENSTAPNQKQAIGGVVVKQLGTFSDNYEQQELYKEPTILIDKVGELYKQGYRHFLYIAKSPYESALNVTAADAEDKLFFMSPRIIKSLKNNRPDLQIYPAFYDKYSVLKLPSYPTTNPAQSLFIQDTQELTSIVEDRSKNRTAVVFFNLFNGIEVQTQDDSHYYNSVVSYSTWLNMYNDPLLEDKDIRLNLIYSGPIKDEILHFLTLLHFSRYEAAQLGSKNISFKLEPYDNIIGSDDAVGKLAIYRHMRGGAQFNSLAFLTLVRKIITR